MGQRGTGLIRDKVKELHTYSLPRGECEINFVTLVQYIAIYWVFNFRYYLIPPHVIYSLFILILTVNNTIFSNIGTSV